jgi:hypothetical protein
MMGVISTAMVVTSSERRAKAKRVQLGNREWVTVIQGINSQGRNVSPFVVVAGKNHLVCWYQNSGFSPDWVIAVTNNGWTTNEKRLDWIRHFEKHTKPELLVVIACWSLMVTGATTRTSLRSTAGNTTLLLFVCRLILLIYSSHLMLAVSAL